MIPGPWPGLLGPEFLVSWPLGVFARFASTGPWPGYLARLPGPLVRAFYDFELFLAYGEAILDTQSDFCAKHVVPVLLFLRSGEALLVAQ